MSSTTDHALSAEDVEFFTREGYLVLKGFIDPEFNQRLKVEVDELIQHRKGGEHRMLVTYPEMGALTTYPPMMDKIESIMGAPFAMHHIHSARHDAGANGVHWHQDYEQVPHTNHSHIMVHVFYYLSGLNGEVGDLLCLPGSQHSIVAGRELSMFGTADLPGSLCFNDLPPGSAVIVHSALWHARRPKPGGEGRPRHFIDISYCQNGILWPGYPGFADINAAAIAHGHDRDGRYAYVFDSAQFFNKHEVNEKFRHRNKGSIALQMKDL